MTMGDKIRHVRQSKGMTQRQVAGDRITRNMLSKIENGSATPSIKTLNYIAERLGLPSSYFLSGSSESGGGERRGVEGAREAYRRGDFTQALALLEQSEGAEAERSDEIAALRALALVGLARGEYRRGDMNRARAYAREALKHNESSLYYMGDVAVECYQIIMLCAVRSKNPSIVADGREAARLLREEEKRGGLAERTGIIEQFWLAERFEHIESEQPAEHSDAWAQAMRHYLRGRSLLAEGSADAAAEELRVAESAAANDGGLMLLDDIYAALEQASRERSDYRAAYEYAAKRLALHTEN